MKRIIKLCLPLVLLISTLGYSILAAEELKTPTGSISVSQPTVQSGETVVYTLNDMDLSIPGEDYLGDFQIDFYTEYYSKNAELESITIPKVDSNSPYIQISLMGFDKDNGWNDFIEPFMIESGSGAVISREEIMEFVNGSNDGQLPARLKMYFTGSDYPTFSYQSKVNQMNFEQGVEFHYNFNEEYSEYSGVPGVLFFQGNVSYYLTGPNYSGINYVESKFNAVSYFDTSSLSVSISDNNIAESREFTMDLSLVNNSSNVTNVTAIYIDKTNIELVDNDLGWLEEDGYYILPITGRLLAEEILDFQSTFRIDESITTSFDIEVGTLYPNNPGYKTAKDTLPIIITPILDDEDEYTVEYDLAGGINPLITDTNEYTADDSITLTSEVPSLDGHTFIGWTLGNDTKYLTNETIRVEDIMDYATDNKFVFIAQYEEETQEETSYTVKYDLAGGSNTSIQDTNEYTENDTLTIASGIPTKEGYTFIGWTLGKDTHFLPREEVVLANIIEYSVEDELVFVAEYTKDNDGGPGEKEDEDNESESKPENPDKETNNKTPENNTNKEDNPNTLPNTGVGQVILLYASILILTGTLLTQLRTKK